MGCGAIGIQLCKCSCQRLILHLAILSIHAKLKMKWSKWIKWSLAKPQHLLILPWQSLSGLLHRVFSLSGRMEVCLCAMWWTGQKKHMKECLFCCERRLLLRWCPRKHPPPSHGGALLSGDFSSAMLRTSTGTSLRVHAFVLKPWVSRQPMSDYGLALTWHKCSKHPPPTVWLSRKV